MKMFVSLITLLAIGVGGGLLLRAGSYDFQVTGNPKQALIIESVPKEKPKPPERRPQNPPKLSTSNSQLTTGIPSLSLSTETLEQGDTLVVFVTHPKRVKLFINETPVPLIAFSKEYAVAIRGFDVRQTPRVYNITLEKDGVAMQTEQVEVRKRDFPVTELVLSETQKAQGETPKTAAKSIAQNDNAKLYEVLDTPLPEILFQEPFAYPLPEQIVVGGFGNIRKSGKTEIRHLGTDLDGKRGDPVQAVNSGRVRLATHLSNYGNTVIIDHGAEIFSLYLHLDSISANIENDVIKGEILGTIGNTGAYSLDPHLHLSIKANGASVDPLRFIKATQQTAE